MTASDGGSTAAVIRTHGLGKAYTTGRWPTRGSSSVRALQGLDLVVQPGEIFGFLGPNGAGKPTTLRTLLAPLRPT